MSASTAPGEPAVAFRLNETDVSVPGAGSLLDALRERLGVRSAKDGCSPQGQCGCCTVWIDGSPRVACVTPVTRVAGRTVVTIEGLADADDWAAAFAAAGASQCGFCTPGIVMRLAALDASERRSDDTVRSSLLAHLCRCTGWQPVVDAAVGFDAGRAARRQPVQESEQASTRDSTGETTSESSGESTRRAERRAAIEGRVAQDVGPAVALGRGGFADDTTPAGALVAVRSSDGSWVVGESLADARRRSGTVQGRRTTAPLTWPLEVPPGDWALTLRTTWVEPAYLEPDAAWCEPGGEPVSSLGNGGAFGGKLHTEVGAAARRLADEHGRPVRALYTREDVVRHGVKRPPIAAGIRTDGTGVVHAVRTPGIAAAVASVAAGVEVVEHDVAGPATSTDPRAAGWAEAAVLLSALRAGHVDTVVSPDGAVATARIDVDGTVHITVRCGDPLDETVLRSYCTGAAHMALGWVRTEGIAVDADGHPLDLTIRSFGILRAVDTPRFVVEIEPDDGPAVNGSDAVFAAVAAAAWRHAGHGPSWPVGR